MVNKLSPYLTGFLRSVSTYTRIPVKANWEEQDGVAHPVCFLPWVGLIVAVLSAWPLLFFSWSDELQAIFMLLSAVLITGAFHEDGLLDSADGLVGGWNQEQRLAIMKDSRIGSFAAITVVFSILIKWWLLTQWIDNNEWQGGALSVLGGWIAVHVLARILPLLMMSSLSYVSSAQSKSASMIAKLSFRDWCVALSSLLLCFISVGLISLLLSIIALGIFFLIARVYLNRRIRGFNGDTLGAVEQISEALVIFSLLGFAA
ncbi:adenosylcobinamide-GDP ribazoletransferase [Marinomonas mediterranea]|uniref:adenosylcobinamide-GDP ribazoletransferase n=1 Tax=Marinomonas mediterranea TaxID=119864 RepID=UPI0023490601|nr:adenosylcobinamide-GDP ribazoletransferase [Marinomonas mediterranea]WCN14377.1 adenosylcobinamide-GDP ribazoletransferase [Marinomonas mediterranea]